MPDALIVDNKEYRSIRRLINKMVKLGIIKAVTVRGATVYGRHYLTNAAIRKAYYKKERNQ